MDSRADIYSAAVILFEMMVPELLIPKAGTPKDLSGLKWSLQDRFFQKRPSELNPNIDREMDESCSQGVIVLSGKALCYRAGVYARP